MSKKLMVWVGSGLVVATMAGATSYWAFHKIGPLVPQALARRMDFAPYTPTALPKGYSVDRDSVKFEDGYLHFSIDSPLGRLVVTQQKRPANFTLDGLSEQGMDEIQLLTVPAGAAATAKLGDRISGFILSESTLIGVSGPANLPREAMQSVLNALRS
jgi:hypothetical protein